MHFNFSATVATLGSALLFSASYGCGSGDHRQAVSGIVTLDGAPLATGTINFRPAGTSKGNTAGAAIAAGQFAIGAKHGLTPGTYAVEIRAFRNTGRTVQDPQLGAIAESESISFTAATPLEVEVTTAGTEPFELALHSIEGGPR